MEATNDDTEGGLVVVDLLVDPRAAHPRGLPADPLGPRARVVVTMLYLIHFDRPLPRHRLGRADDGVRHYLGFSDDVEARLAAHRAGNGSHLMAAVAANGIGWTCVRTWPGTRSDERRAKNRHRHSAFCPICRGEA